MNIYRERKIVQNELSNRKGGGGGSEVSGAFILAVI